VLERLSKMAETSLPFIEPTKNEDEKVPLKIIEEYFRQFRDQSTAVLNALQGAQSEFLNDFERIITVCDRLDLNLRDEEAKVRFMTENHVDSTKRVEEAVKVSQRDKDTIRKLQEEVVEAWKLVDDSKTKEIQAHEKLEKMRVKFAQQQQEISKLSGKIDASDMEDVGQTKTVMDEIERLTSENSELNHRLMMQRSFTNELQNKIEEAQEKERDLHQQWDEATNDSLANKKRLDIATKKVTELEETNDEVTQSLREYKSKAESRLRMLKERELQLSEKRDEIEKLELLNSSLATAKETIEHNLKSIISEVIDLRHSEQQSKHFLKLKDDENKKFALENDRSLKKIEAQTRKIADVSFEVSKKVKEILILKNELTSAERERDLIKRSNDVIRREKDSLQKKVEISLKEIEKREGLTAIFIYLHLDSI
jgi:chromosome segregation ATPase